MQWELRPWNGMGGGPRESSKHWLKRMVFDISGGRLAEEIARIAKVMARAVGLRKWPGTLRKSLGQLRTWQRELKKWKGMDGDLRKSSRHPLKLIESRHFWRKLP